VAHPDLAVFRRSATPIVRVRVPFAPSIHGQLFAVDPCRRRRPPFNVLIDLDGLGVWLASGEVEPVNVPARSLLSARRATRKV
jgi:hypothetical protein